MGKRIISFIIYCVLLTSLLSLSACGREEHQQGIDGCVYEAELLTGTAHWGINIKNNDDWLYYIDYGTLYRIPLEEGGMPGKTGRAGVPGTEGLLDYAVDAESSVYCYRAAMNEQDSGTIELDGGTLTRYGEDGSEEYSLSLEGRHAVYARISAVPGLLAAGGDRVFLLMGDEVLAVDGEGKIIGEADVSGIRPDDKDYSAERLLEGEGGRVYYLTESPEQNICRIYELVEEGSSFRPRILSMKGLDGKDLITGDFYGSGRGMLYSGRDGILYCYSPAEDTWKELLRWGDSNLDKAAGEVGWLSEGRLFAAYRDEGYGNDVYLLERKGTEEIPEQQELLLACWDSCPGELEDAVIRFNRESEIYHVTVQLYEDEAWLDAKLVSSSPPDMLLLLPLNVEKYGRKQVLENLDAYLDDSSNMKREDFLEKPLERYIIDGRLLGIPSEFMCTVLVGDASETGSQAGWTLEDVMALTEKFPGRKLSKRDFRWNLENFCGDYIMDTFIDEESGTCHFDSEEFRKLIQWLGEYSVSQTQQDTFGEEERPLFYEKFVCNIFDYMRYVSRSGEDVAFAGYPSPEGSPRYGMGAFNAVGIVSKSQHKDGAWQFIESFLSQGEADYGALANMPVRKDLMEDVLAYAVTPEYWMHEGEIEQGQDGSPMTKPKWSMRYEDLSGEMVEASYDYATEEETEGLLELISQAEFASVDDLQAHVMSIIAQEAESFLNGSKSLEEVTKVMQSRVSVMVQENR